MLIAPQAKSTSKPTLQTKARRSPIRGLDLSSPIDAVSDGYALRLDDWVCREDGVTTRGGYAVVGDVGSAVTSLMGYEHRLLVATDVAIYDGPSAVVSGLNGGDWMGVTVSNPGGRHLVCFNGVDEPRKFGGWSWSVAAITGVDGRDLVAPCLHQRRVFAVEQETLRVWYLGLDAIEGPASVLPLDAQVSRGGVVMAAASLQPSGGRTTDAKLCIVTSNGELVIYSGTDPDNAETWSHAGTWVVPKPIGRRCFAQIGGQLALLTVDGVLSVPGILSEPGSSKSDKALTEKIGGRVIGARDVLDCPSAELMMVDAGAVQWVKTSQGWSRWTGFATATCWIDLDGSLFFGRADGKVCRYGGETDNGAPIQSFAVDAFSAFGTGRHKAFSRIRPRYTLAHPYVPRIELLQDYREPPATFAAANVDSRFWQWDEITWGAQPLPWYKGAVSSRLQPWRSVAGRCEVAACMMSLQTLTPVVWTGYDVAFQQGGAL